ncbi:MAG: hypothetical protein ACI8R4_002198, partial [Paracoccaceae bacterium]
MQNDMHLRMDWRSVNFDWNRARAFLVTAEEGSLSAAARALSRDSRVAQRIAVSLSIQFCDGIVNGLVKIIQVSEGLMGEVV